MNNPFNTILVKKPTWSKQPLTHEWKSSVYMCKLMPFLSEQINPGETWRVGSEVEMKFSPLISPVMHRINLFTNYFYVPWYQIWSPYDDFISGGTDGTLSLETPWITPKGIINACKLIYEHFHTGPDLSNSEQKCIWGFKHSIFDYMGLPQTIITNNFDNDSYILADEKTHIHCTSFMAYVKIWCEYFADQTQDQELIEKFNVLFDLPKSSWITSGNDLVDVFASYTDIYLWEFFVLRSRCWEHDYFTSALPFAQRGPQVTVPIAGQAPVEVEPQSIIISDITDLGLHSPSVTFNGGELPQGADHWEILNSGQGYGNVRALESLSGQIQVHIQAYDSSNNPVGNPTWANVDDLYSSPDSQVSLSGAVSKLVGSADLTEASAVSINTFRWLERLQTFLEKNARAGARYVEQLLVHWGVKGDDLRLMRPEYLAGSMQPIKVGEVLQTSQTTTGEGGSPLAEYAGYAMSAGNMNGFKHRFKYHGELIGLMCVMPRTSYFQGIPRKFLKSSRFDYAFPEFNHLGEQEVFNAELYYTNDPDTMKQAFGYLPRYSEYRYIPSSVHGDFVDNLLYWHMARNFDSLPSLNSEFLQGKSIDRIFAVQDDTAHMWCQILNKISAVRPISKHAIPSL